MRDHVTCLLTTSYALSICELSCFFIVKSIRTALMRETSAVVVVVSIVKVTISKPLSLPGHIPDLETNMTFWCSEA
jgi:hypothetical protein